MKTTTKIKSKCYEVTFEYGGKIITSTYLLFPQDKVATIIPPFAKIISIKPL